MTTPTAPMPANALSDALWGRAASLIARVLPRGGGTHDLEDVRAGIVRGDFQLWMVADSVIVTEVIAYPKLMAVNYWLVAGRLDEVRRLEPAINRWAHGIGCSRAQGAGRRGWGRVADGWAAGGVLYMRDL